MEPEVVVEFNLKDGSISVEGVGYTGGQCVDDIDQLMELLGLTKVYEEAKPEMLLRQSDARLQR